MSIIQWYSNLSRQSKLIAVFLGLFGLLLIGIFFSVISDVNRQRTSESNVGNGNTSSSNATAPTPFVAPPSTLSPAVNLEKGTTALNQGDNGTAWAHLSAIPKTTNEYVSAKQLLTRIPERQQIEFELAELADRESNLKRISSGLAYQVEASELKKRLDSIETQLRAIYARRQELNRRLQKLS